MSQGQDGPVALYAHTSFARLVCLNGRNAPSFQATVWNADSVVKSVPSSQWQDGAQKAVLEQVESFIAARKAAASRDGAARTTSNMPALPGSTASASQAPFVASQSGSVFHRPDWEKVAGRVLHRFAAEEQAHGGRSLSRSLGRRRRTTCEDPRTARRQATHQHATDLLQETPPLRCRLLRPFAPHLSGKRPEWFHDEAR